jgi:DNA-binding transcriptional LysR family regulator
MTLDQLRIFVAVAEREHMTRAAEALNLTQSAVSAAIQALESRHDVVLFHRIGRGIELTASGRLFLSEAKAVLARAHAAETALADLGDLKRGTLAVSASQTIASYWLPARIVRFRESYPQLDIRLRVGTSAQVARDVIEGTVEVGFVEGAIEEPTLDQQKIGGDRLLIVVGGSHPWFGNHRIGIADLTATRWVFREAGSGTRSALNSALEASGIIPGKLDVALELPSNNAVRAAVIAGAGAAGLSDLVVDDALRLGSLFQLPIVLPERGFFLLHHKERKMTKATVAFVESVSQAYPDR